MATNISIIIPAYNAAATIVETLESVLAQTNSNWEAIVIDDGSVDETIAVVDGYCAKEKRITRLSQLNQGVSAARNTGIDHANFEWLLFLDADDWISPYYVERTINLIDSDPGLDAVHCGWVRIAPDGTQLKERYAPEFSDLFPVLATTCPFAVHACSIRKTIANKAGRFDPAVKNCQDWDFWQRVARTGAKFGAVREVLALYRMQANSLSSDRNQFYADAMRMLIQGHSPDPRVLVPDPKYKDGQSRENLSSLKLYLTSWFAGLLIGKEKNAKHLLKYCEFDHDPSLDAFIIAGNIFETVLISNNQPFTAWQELWPKIDRYISDFLKALELQSRSEGLERSTLNFLEGMILQNTQLVHPVKIGTTQGFRMEITEPIPDIYPIENTERIYCKLQMEGSYLGKLELPVCGKIVPGWLIIDAIAAQFAWQILGRFFEHTVYQTGREIVENPQNKENQGSENIHDRIGWKVFLQQLWARPNSERFNKSERKNKMALTLFRNSDLQVIEICKKLPKIIVAFKKLRIVLTIGGVSMGIINIPFKNVIITARALKNIINREGNFELCRICVREALIGTSLNEQTSLQERLRKAAAVSNNLKKNTDSIDAPYCLPGFVTSKTTILANRYDIIGTSSSRRAMLPVNSIFEIIEMAKSAGESVLQTTIPGGGSVNILYVPEIIKILPINTDRSIKKSTQGLSSKKSSITPHVSNKSETLNSSLVVTEKLPILKYHGIALKGEPDIRYNVTPESFDEQLQYLRNNNYYSVKWDDWINAMFRHTPLPGKAVAITFDDGSLDFYQYAWPLLKKYGFAATVFLSTNYIRPTNSWHKNLNEEIRLMGWPEIMKLQSEGAQFGSHSLSHRSLTALSVEDIVCEAAKSRTILQQKLGMPVKIFAYPYGHTDPVVTHLVGACGYTLALTSQPALSTFADNTLNLPRIEIEGSFNLQDFIGKLN
ncbi:MAG: glycosyltransferase [Ginsengibacter sp.]